MNAARPDLIRKSSQPGGVTPNWTDYEALRKSFSWEQARRELGQPAGGGMNIAWAAVERHAQGIRADRTAFRFVDDAGTTTISYAQLSRESNRFANVLKTLGVARGDAVFLLAGRSQAMYVATLGTFKNGCVACPLFPAFGPEPLATRMKIGDARVLVTTQALYRRKVAAMRESLPGLRQVLLTGCDRSLPMLPGTLDLDELMAQAATGFDIVATAEEDPALLHFTSGTTGTPKGAIHVHGAVVTHYATGKYALDLHDEDVFWCTADPGWVTGMSYGIIAPLLHGVTSVVDAGEFDAQRWYEILETQQVSVWYTAPTALRMLMRAGPALARAHAYPRLRFIASVGEPLNPEAVWWGQDVLGLPVHDNWWQTETGGIMIANTPAFDIKPGSMGRPLPGVDACIVRRDESGTVQMVEQAGEQGELALRRGWPSMLRGYLHNEERYQKCFAGELYLTGDLARRDDDGYFWFVGRSDDVIKCSGHLVGPFEIENALMEHPAVAEAGAIGKPDPTTGESIKAFVSLKPGFEPAEALRLELLGHARSRLGAAIAPKEIAFLPVLPRTRSGKIMRRLLKARELGLPEGDISTLEAGA